MVDDKKRTIGIAVDKGEKNSLRAKIDDIADELKSYPDDVPDEDCSMLERELRHRKSGDYADDDNDTIEGDEICDKLEEEAGFIDEYGYIQL